jgi:Inosine-uridine preferring nucleoside hydrolase
MQFEQVKPSVGIVFDSDLGRGVDAALALALLYGLEGKGEARLVSNSTTISNLKAAAFADVLARFYAGPPPAPGAFRGFQPPDPPVGMAGDGTLAGDAAVLKAVLEKKTAEGAPVYPHRIEKLNDTADPVALIRNAMTAQYDDNCLVVLAGPATNLVKVMDLPGTLDLIKRKVKYLALAAGSYPDGRAEYRVKADTAAAKRLLAEWPTPIVAVGTEVGDGLPFPGSSIERDFAWAPAHPIADAYRAFQTMPYDAPAASMAAVLYAVRPDGYFKLSAPGTIGVLADGRTRFTPAQDGRHRYLVIDPAQKEKVIQTYAELASAKPVPRQNPRFRREPKKNAPPPVEPVENP